MHSSQSFSRSSPLFETTPADMPPTLSDFVHSLGDGLPLRVPVRPISGGESGWCFKNVAKAAAAWGGTPVHGRCIWSCLLFCTAESHVVLRLDDGSLVDPTPTRDGEKEIVFVVDPTMGPDFDFMQRPPNRRARLYNGISAERRAADLIRCMNPAERTREELRAGKSGLDVTAYVAGRLERDHLEVAIENFLRLAAEAEARLRPTPQGMWCEDIPRWRETEERKARAALRLERSWRARHPGH